MQFSQDAALAFLLARVHAICSMAGLLLLLHL
jgi:hypothetical protein